MGSLTALHALMATCPDSKREIIATVVSRHLGQGTGGLDETEISTLNSLIEQSYADLGSDAKLQISGNLASSTAISNSLVLRLADEDVEIATPLLTNSPVLSSDDLLSIIREQGNGHRLAISNRDVLDRSVTEMLITLGDHEVKLSVSSNLGADISPEDYDRLVAALPEKPGGRIAHLRKLVDTLVADLKEHRADIGAGGTLEEQTVSTAFEKWFAALSGGQVNLGAVISRMCADKNLFDIVRILSEMSGMRHQYVTWLMLHTEAAGIGIVCRMLGVGSSEYGVLSRVRCSHLRLPQFMGDMWANNYTSMNQAEAKRLFGLLMLRLETETDDVEQVRKRA